MSMMINNNKYAKYDPSFMRITISSMLSMYECIYLDPGYQRLGGYENQSGWSLEEGQEYITSHAEGETGNEALLVDLDEALRWTRDRAKDTKSVKYYEKTLSMEIVRAQTKTVDGAQTQDILSRRRAVHSVVDGNNTLSNLYWYVKGAFPAALFGNSEMRYFDDLSEAEQNHFLHSTYISIIILRRIGIDDTKRLFKKSNSSTNLNNQENRHCEPGDISDFVRDTANLYRQVFEARWKKGTAAYDKLAHHEFLAALVQYHDCGRDTTTKKLQLDMFYNDQRWNNSKTPTEVVRILKDLAPVLQSQQWSNHLKAGEFTIYWRVISMLQEAAYNIVDHAALCAAILDHITTNHSAFKAQKYTDDEKPYQDWNHWVSFWNIKDIASRLDRYYFGYVGANAPDWEAQNIIRRRHPRSSNDVFSFRQKIDLFCAQGREDRFGDDLTVYDLWGGKLEADHVKAVANGGKTIFSNAELTTRKANRTKGATDYAPHFEHQQLDPAFPEDAEDDG